MRVVKIDATKIIATRSLTPTTRAVQHRHRRHHSRCCTRSLRSSWCAAMCARLHEWRITDARQSIPGVFLCRRRASKCDGMIVSDYSISVLSIFSRRSQLPRRVSSNTNYITYVPENFQHGNLKPDSFYSMCSSNGTAMTVDSC